MNSTPEDRRMTAGPLWLLTAARLRAVGHVLRALPREGLFKASVVTFLGGGLWVVLFVLFNQSFHFLNVNMALFRDMLMPYVLSLFFLSLLTMLIFSNALISFSNLFRSPETAFLFSLPVPHETLYLYKLLESLLFSSWAFFALGLPLLLAYGIQTHVPWYFYPALLLFLVPYVVLPAALGACLGLVLTAVVPRHRGKFLGALALSALVAAIYVGYNVAHVRFAVMGSDWYRTLPTDVDRILAPLHFTQHPLAPSFWISHGLLALGEGGPGGWFPALLFFAALSTGALFFLLLGWCLSGVLYARTYSFASAAVSRTRRAAPWWGERLARPLLERYPAVTVLVLKDIKTFLRDPVQWSQVLIFFGLLTVYIANLRNFNYQLDEPFYQNLISFLNLGATSLTLATLVSRFVFPLISLEGRRFWVLGLAPVARRQVLWAKFVFSCGGALLITQALVLLSNYVLRTSGLLLVAQMLTAALLCFGLTGLGVGLGALFPSMRETNPSKIVAGFGGTLNLLLSIGLVMVTIMVEGAVCHRYIVMERALVPDSPAYPLFVRDLSWTLVFIAVLNLLATWVPLKLGQRALERMEF